MVSYIMQQKRGSLKIGLFSSLACHLLFAAVLIYGYLTTPKSMLTGGDPALKVTMVNALPSMTPSSVPISDLKSKINQKQNEKTSSERDFTTHSPLKKKDRYAIEQHKRKMRSVDTSPQHTMTKARPERIANVNAPSKVGIPGDATTSIAGEIPSIRHRRAPEYPRKALALGIEGKVVVRYDITPHGRVSNVRIVKAEPNTVFNRSVRRAMRFWQYQPNAARNLTITIIFKQDKSVKLHG